MINPEYEYEGVFAENRPEFQRILQLYREGKKDLIINKYVCQSRMCDKAVKATVKKLKCQVKKVQRKQNPKEVNRLNPIILGSHNYYNKL